MNAVSTEVVTAEPIAAPAPLQMLQAALASGATPDQIQHMMDLQDRWEATQARKAYVAAMSDFKRHPPEILKDKHVSYQTSKGKTEYKHATLGNVCAAIIKGLSDVGISHRWDTQQQEGRIKVTCILTHVGGHSESTSLHSAADESGGKNSIQAIASAITYLQRYTLLAATGLATADMGDDDARASEQVETVGPGQIANIEALMSEVGADRAKFLAYLKLDSVDQIPAANYSNVIRLLEAKRGR